MTKNLLKLPTYQAYFTMQHQQVVGKVCCASDVDALTSKVLELLEDAYDEGFAEGFHCEDNPGEAKNFTVWLEQNTGIKLDE